MAAFVDAGIIYEAAGAYRIKFLDDQLDEMETRRGLRSKAGKASAAKRAADHESKEETPEPETEATTTDAGEVEKEKPAKPKKIGYGEFGNVKLTAEEHEKLTAAHGAERLAAGIELLGDYIKAKGKRYADHYAVLKSTSWVWRRLDEDQGKGGATRDWNGIGTGGL